MYQRPPICQGDQKHRRNSIKVDPDVRGPPVAPSKTAAVEDGLLSRRPLARGLFALPLRCEFEPRYCRGGTGEVLPDLMMLVDLLTERGWHCEQIGEVSSEEAGTAENAIAVLSVRAGADRVT